MAVSLVDPEGDGPLDEREFDPGEWDPDFVGDTRAHRFIGGFSELGIVRLRIEGADQIDHLQYGWAIPEPSVGILALLGVAVCGLRRRRGGNNGV